LLAALPDHFGIPEANAAYAAFAETHETWVAIAPDDSIVGLLSGRRHFPECAEIEIMAVHPDWHRHGIGRRLVDAFEAHHAAAGVRLIEVKTLGASHPDVHYARTRDFYLGIGFLRVEESDLWGPENPALIMVRPVIGRACGRSA
jgi:GNAT superfamily N-acetyltransferase